MIDRSRILDKKTVSDGICIPTTLAASTVRCVYRLANQHDLGARRRDLLPPPLQRPKDLTWAQPYTISPCETLRK
jgi:hypothetical protein